MDSTEAYVPVEQKDDKEVGVGFPAAVLMQLVVVGPLSNETAEQMLDRILNSADYKSLDEEKALVAIKSALDSYCSSQNQEEILGNLFDEVDRNETNLKKWSASKIRLANVFFKKLSLKQLQEKKVEQPLVVKKDDVGKAPEKKGEKKKVDRTGVDASGDEDSAEEPVVNALISYIKDEILLDRAEVKEKKGRPKQQPGRYFSNLKVEKIIKDGKEAYFGPKALEILNGQHKTLFGQKLPFTEATAKVFDEVIDELTKEISLELKEVDKFLKQYTDGEIAAILPENAKVKNLREQNKLDAKAKELFKQNILRSYVFKVISFYQAINPGKHIDLFTLFLSYVTAYAAESKNIKVQAVIDGDVEEDSVDAPKKVETWDEEDKQEENSIFKKMRENHQAKFKTAVNLAFDQTNAQKGYFEAFKQIVESIRKSQFYRYLPSDVSKKIIEDCYEVHKNKTAIASIFGQIPRDDDGVKKLTDNQVAIANTVLQKGNLQPIPSNNISDENLSAAPTQDQTADIAIKKRALKVLQDFIHAEKWGIENRFCLFRGGVESYHEDYPKRVKLVPTHVNKIIYEMTKASRKEQGKIQGLKPYEKINYAQAYGEIVNIALKAKEQFFKCARGKRAEHFYNNIFSHLNIDVDESIKAITTAVSNFIQQHPSTDIPNDFRRLAGLLDDKKYNDKFKALSPQEKLEKFLSLAMKTVDDREFKEETRRFCNSFAELLKVDQNKLDAAEKKIANPKSDLGDVEINLVF